MTLGQLQVFSPIFIVASALAFIGLERIFPYNKGQKVFREGFWVDLVGYGILQSYVLTLVISSLIYFIDNNTGISRLRIVSDWPIWAQVLLFIVWHDFNTYWIHRTQHRSKWLWRTHEAHHACKDVDWLAGIRSHSGEILIYQTVEYLPVILLGAAPEVPLYKGMANAVYGMYIHSNLNWRMGKLLYFLNGPELHRWHHANDDESAFNRNFATKIATWDWLFGSGWDPKGRQATLYGPEDPAFPKGYFAQHFFAFRPFKKTPTAS
jgi:sterol desaturase/sphingolipid hydroxylase (fatty acid hydroxylase superfamily)